MPTTAQLKSKPVSTNWSLILNLIQQSGITNASSGVSYTHTYNYDAIGNITTSTPAGIYVYGSSTYANPHAATSVSSTIYSYDNNGNLTSDSIWTHTWDYRNRLTQSTKTGATSTYAYDHTTSRVRLVTASSTTIIPSANYSVEGGTAVKYISANGMLLATIRGTGASSSLYAIHSDHLGNVEKTTNTEGAIVEISDYYPFGSVRQNTKYGGFDDRKGFIGKDTDSDTGLSQLEARYYMSSVGRFMSQDPVFWEVGMTQDGKAVLANPQAQNSYSYASNNPITKKDPTGRLDSKALLNATLSQLISILGQLYALLGASNFFSPITPVASSLMNHSLQVDPKPLTITGNNQGGYGNAIDSIKKDDDFNSYIKRKIKQNEKDGKVTVDLKPENSFAFESGDLFFAFHNVNGGFSGTKSQDGSWDLKVNLSDRYDFKYGSEKFNTSLPGNIVNNWAYLGQQSGAITNYYINVTFDYRYNPN